MLSTDLLLAFSAFALISSITPGPNNTMLLASGAAFGFRRTLPHMLGVTGGFFLMVLSIGLGFGALFRAFPGLYDWLRYLGAAYLIYLAAVIAMSGPPKAGEATGRGPMSFWGAAVFQWVNIKGWVMVIGTITAYAAIARFPLNIAIQTLLCLLLGVLSTATWTLFGSALRPVLKSAAAVRAFNVVMALLLLASLYPVFRDA